MIAPPRPHSIRLLLVVGIAMAPGAAPEDDPAKPAPRPASANAPPCPLHKAARPVARSRPAGRPASPFRVAPGVPSIPGPMSEMAGLFGKMAERFATNPAGAFPSMLDELASLEEPALAGVTLSAAEEREAGRKAREEYLRRADSRGYKVAKDENQIAYMKGLVDRLARRMAHRDRYPRLDVTLIDAPIADGHSFPGGFLVFTTALLDEPDEATVAGVVAHELAHLDLGHLYGYARRDKLAESTFRRSPGGGPDFDGFFTRSMALFGLMMNPYRPEHELEADCRAATWMFLEGYDPQALVDFFARLHGRLRDRPADPNFAFGRSHPYTLERKAHAERRRAQLLRWKPDQEISLHPEPLGELRSRGPAPAP